MTVISRAAWSDLPPETAYAVLRLRVDVFVVEQACPYPELDGRDTEADAEHLWASGPGGEAVAAYLRVLREPGGSGNGSWRVGRVATAPSARGHGLAGRLLDDVVARRGSSHLVLDAQSHLEGWYARWGFVVAGPAFVEDGIPHVPMVRTPR